VLKGSHQFQMVLLVPGKMQDSFVSNFMRV